MFGILSEKLNPNKSLVKIAQSFEVSHSKSARAISNLLLIGLPLGSLIVAYTFAHQTSSPPTMKSAPQTTHASVNKQEAFTPLAKAADPISQFVRPADPKPAYLYIEPYETTADEAFSLLKDDCTLEDQTVKPDSKMPDSLEIRKIYICGRRKLQLYFNRTDAEGPYMVTFKSYVD